MSRGFLSPPPNPVGIQISCVFLGEFSFLIRTHDGDGIIGPYEPVPFSSVLEEDVRRLEEAADEAERN